MIFCPRQILPTCYCYSHVVGGFFWSTWPPRSFWPSPSFLSLKVTCPPSLLHDFLSWPVIADLLFICCDSILCEQVNCLMVDIFHSLFVIFFPLSLCRVFGWFHLCRLPGKTWHGPLWTPCPLSISLILSLGWTSMFLTLLRGFMATVISYLFITLFTTSERRSTYWITTTAFLGLSLVLLFGMILLPACLCAWRVQDGYPSDIYDPAVAKMTTGDCKSRS